VGQLQGGARAPAGYAGSLPASPAAGPVHYSPSSPASAGQDWPAISSGAELPAHFQENLLDSSTNTTSQLLDSYQELLDPAPGEAQEYAGPLVDNLEIDEEEVTCSQHECAQVWL
jgi:hypothetical protein